MMVIFISQCEKNALKKTRRTLDAFANRIGDNTWQTVITEEGLSTVKKMLRQTASKSTAVSCHWIRSRSRSEFLWVVGNKNKFNEQGEVPVNYTSNDKNFKMDEKCKRVETPYANTKMQPLDQHLFAVGFVAYCLIKKLVHNDANLAFAVFVAGCLHDIGKLDPAFQNWIMSVTSKKSLRDDLSEDGQHIDKGSFSFDKHARHNEISFLIYQFFNDEKYLGNNKLREFVGHAIYWHHAKPVRKNDYKEVNHILKKLGNSLDSNNTNLSDLIDTIRSMIGSINKISRAYLDNPDMLINGLNANNNTDHIDEDKSLPKYKNYDADEKFEDYHKLIKENAKKSIMRTCVITADRLVSALMAKQLTEFISNKNLESILSQALNLQSDLKIQIESCLHNFEEKFPQSDRNHKQAVAAQQLSEIEKIAVLKGPAGCGKTKIALEWASKTEVKKIIWICPRVQVCQGIFLDLTSSEYLPDSKIEICTGEYKHIQQENVKMVTSDKNEFSGDIVITTIDHMVNTVITHSNITSLVDFMNAHIVFDEYHEYVHMDAFNILFAELVHCKKLHAQNAKTLLVSATPNYCFIEKLLDIDKENIVSIESFNQSTYQIAFDSFDETKEDDSNILFSAQPPNSIVISNTALTAQKSFIKNQNKENAMLFHAGFTSSDKKIIFNKVFDAFKKSGTKAYDVLRSGPILQASLNITCDYMVTEFTHAENWLQRLGRLDRFGERKELNQYVMAIPKTLAEGNEKQIGQCAKWLNKLNCFESAKSWYRFLQNKQIEQPISINKIYQWYDEFYRSEQNRSVIESDLLKSLKQSAALISKKVHDPLCFPKKLQNKDRKKLKKSSLRSDSRFVQMAVCKVKNNGALDFLNEYACDGEEKTFTMSLDKIEGDDPGGDKNLINYMYQKHHKILTAQTDKAHKKPYKSFALNNAAVECETPIYLSYTSEDLALCNDSPHQHAIYYVIGEKQAIGPLSVNELNHNIINNER